jgi:hypothetical protein
MNIAKILLAVETAPIQTKPACFEKVLHLNKPSIYRTFRSAGLNQLVCIGKFCLFGNISNRDRKIYPSMRQRSGYANGILSWIVVILVWLSSSQGAIAGTLSQRMADFPQWQSPPQIGKLEGQLIYPEWFKGRWLATSTLLEQVAPLAPDLVTPGFDRNRTYLVRPIEFKVQFIPLEVKAATPSLLNLPRRNRPLDPAQIVPDRAYNGYNISIAYLGADKVRSVKVDPQNPTKQITQLEGDRQLVSIVTGFAQEQPNPNNFIAAELSQQIFSSDTQIYFNTVETTTNYQFSSTPTPNIAATQITAIYLSPQDPEYFRARNRPVALYKYHLDLTNKN